MPGNPLNQRAVLFVPWMFTLFAGLFCLGVFIRGLVRDSRTGQPSVAIDLSRPSTGSETFRVWREGEYGLAISSVNHTPPFDVPFRGIVEVRLSDAEGRDVLKRIVDGGSTQHVRPDNMSWTPLDSIRLVRNLASPMTLTARVLRPDPQFAGVATLLHLRLRQNDPGMGGLVNYVALFPGILFLAAAVGLAIIISQRNLSAVPLVLTVGLVLVAGLVTVLVRP